MKTTQPLGNPKYQDNLAAVECDLNVNIECDAQDCRIVHIKENGEICESFISPTLLVCIKNDDSDCIEANQDYRKSNTSGPYVNLIGYRAECSNKRFEIANFSIYPKKGQTVEELAEEVRNLICSCLLSKIPAAQKIQTNIIYSLFFDTYKGGPLNGNPLTWTDPQFLWDGVNPVEAFRVRLRSFRINGLEQVPYNGPTINSPEWLFDTDFVFEESLWDESIQNQNISNWLNTLDFVKDNDIIVKDNGGIFIHNEGTVIDFVIYPERRLNGSWQTWPSRSYGISTELGDGYSGSAFTNIIGFQSVGALNNFSPYAIIYNP